MIEIKLRFKHEPRHSHGVPFQRPKWGTNVNIKCSTNVKLFNHACLHHTIVSSCPSPSQDSDALHSSGINGTRWHRLYFLLHQPVSHLVPRWRFCFQFWSKRFIVAFCFWALINKEGSKGQAAMRSKSLKFHLLGDILQVTGARHKNTRLVTSGRPSLGKVFHQRTLWRPERKNWGSGSHDWRVRWLSNTGWILLNCPGFQKIVHTFLFLHSACVPHEVKTPIGHQSACQVF
jgi:hypothetical protein